MGASLRLHKVKVNSLMFKKLDSQWGWRRSCPLGACCFYNLLQSYFQKQKLLVRLRRGLEKTPLTMFTKEKGEEGGPLTRGKHKALARGRNALTRERNAHTKRRRLLQEGGSSLLLTRCLMGYLFLSIINHSNYGFYSLYLYKGPLHPNTRD